MDRDYKKELEEVSKITDSELLMEKLYPLMRELKPSGVAANASMQVLSAMFKTFYGQGPGSIYKTKLAVATQLRDRMGVIMRSRSFKHI